MTNDSADHGSGTGTPLGGPGGHSAPGPVPPPAPPTDGSGMNGFFAAIRRTGVSRSSDRWVGGVAGGVATRFGIDPLLARGLVGVTMLMGFGLVLYGLAWALLPEQTDGRIHLEETIRGRFDIALLGAIALVVLGLSAGDWWFSWGPFDSGWLGGLAWVAAIVAGCVILVNALRRDRVGRPGPPAWQPPYQEGPSPMSSTGPVGPTPAASTPRPAGAEAPRPPYASASSPAPTYPGQQHAGPAPTGPSYPGPAPTWSAGPPPAPPRGWSAQPPVPPQGPPPRPVRPPKPPRRGPGTAVTGVVVGVILIGLALLLVADRTGAYTGPIASVVVGGSVLLVGLGIIVSGLRGRTGGGLTALAIVGIVVAGPAVAFGDGDDVTWDDGPSFRDHDVTVTSRADAEDGFSFGIGNAVVDLTEVPLTDDTLVVPIDGGVGDVRVIVPEGAAVSAEVTSGAGEIEWLVDGRSSGSDGVGNQRRFTSDAVSEGRDAQIALSVDLGIGSITIEEN